MNKKSLLLLALSLTLPFARAHAAPVDLAGAVNGPFTLLTCQAFNFGDADRWDLAMRSLDFAGHHASFEVLKAAGRTSVFVRAKFSYGAAPNPPYAETTRVMALMDMQLLERENPGYLARNGFEDRRYASLLGAPESYINFPQGSAAVKQSEFSYLGFPYGSLANDAGRVPALLKVSAGPAWSKLYRADCQRTNLTQDQYEDRRMAILDDLPVLNTMNSAQFVAALPTLKDALAEGTVVTPQGDYLGGVKLAAKLGVGAAAGAYAARAFMVIAGAKGARGAGAVGAYFAPLPADAPTYRLDLAGTGFAVDQARAFLASPPEAQASACAAAPGYASFCGRLVELAAELREASTL